MMALPSLSQLSGYIFVAGFIPYLIGIRRGTTVPMKSTWVMYATLDTFSLASLYGSGNVTEQILGACLGNWLVVLLALRYGKTQWSRFEIGCIATGILGMILWGLSRNPVVGVVLTAVVAVVASFPTFLSAWEDPTLESRSAWMLMFVSCVLAMVVLGHPSRWTLANASQPISFTLIETIMVFLVFVRPLWKGRKS